MLASYKASVIAASIVEQTFPFCALKIQPLILWDVIQYTTLYYILPNLYFRWNPVIFSTWSIPSVFQLLLVIRFEWAQSFCVWNILWNKLLSRRPEWSFIYLQPFFLYILISTLSWKFCGGGSWSYPAEILHEPFHLRPALMWLHPIILVIDVGWPDHHH